MPRKRQRRRVCFVTGTRAEFGLMQSTLRALRDHPNVELQLIATGLHTQPTHHAMLGEIRRAGWTIDATVSWAEDSSAPGIAAAMGRATAGLAGAFAKLKSEIVLVVGDRVEAFAAASAAHVSGLAVAHVHGGDRAMGQVDDALRHAIAKLAHIHFPATRASADRLFKFGEDRRRIHVAGAPGIDGIRTDAWRAASIRERLPGLAASMSDHVLILLHPTDADDQLEYRRARLLLDAAGKVFGNRVIALLPNGDPGCDGIVRELRRRAAANQLHLIDHADRGLFLGLMREVCALIGNSSSGIIEAGSFGTAVLDVGARQQGRERGPNVKHIDWNAADLTRAIARITKQKRTRPADNPYERGGAGRRIASALSTIVIDDRLRRKVIRY